MVSDFGHSSTVRDWFYQYLYHKMLDPNQFCFSGITAMSGSLIKVKLICVLLLKFNFGELSQNHIIGRVGCETGVDNTKTLP